MKVERPYEDPCLKARLAYVESLKEPNSKHFLDEPEDIPFMKQVPLDEEVNLLHLDSLRLYKKNLNYLREYYFMRDMVLSLKLEEEVNRIIEFLHQEGKKILLVR